jgi:chromosome segregation ATPase
MGMNLSKDAHKITYHNNIVKFVDTTKGDKAPHKEVIAGIEVSDVIIDGSSLKDISQTVATLQTALQTVSTQLETLKGQVTTAESETKSLMELNNTKDTRIGILESNIVALTHSNTILKKKFDILDTDHSKMNTQLSGMHEPSSEVTDHRASEHTTTTTMTKFIENIRTLKTDILSLRNNHEETAARMEIIESELKTNNSSMVDLLIDIAYLRHMADAFICTKTNLEVSVGKSETVTSVSSDAIDPHAFMKIVMSKFFDINVADKESIPVAI